MENVIFANGFEEYVNGVKQCPSKNIYDERLDSNFPHYVCKLNKALYGLK